MDLSKITAITAGKTKTSGISPFSELEISKVYPNPNQPRKTFDDIEELASTIKEHGLLQPITVVKKDDGYMIVSGERRYKAHLHNESKTIKAYILDTTDEKVEELTFIENIQRNDLTDFETAKYIVKLWESGRYEKKSDLAKKIGKPEKYVSKAFSALKLNSEILEDIRVNKKDISIGVMDEISRVKNKEVQKEVYKKYSNKEITRDEIKDFKEPKKKDLKEKVKDFKAPVACNYTEENSTSGNLKKFELEICCKDGILYQSDIIEAANENQALKKAYEKYPNDAKDKEYNFFVTEIEDDSLYKKEVNKIESLKVKIQELEKEIGELSNKEVYIVGYREMIGSEIGGGFRCRALNENEAIEIAKKERYFEIANDKNIIWEARTLKSYCNSENIFNDWIGYGFGTVNDTGTYIAVIDGDFEATITFKKNGEFIKNTNNKEYQVIIKEFDKKVNTEIQKKRRK
ncbi:ParB/RepB/Spo0J family partition protein [Aliarcobacter butzleri]|uniref:ParB/RepB/Spo0J family partition protein n=1 Tax=Aliarcobacter butzleri TaxID=28197 RepID=UPI00125F0873|nr:ParB/RepB/Spo0J family partition protein [Aliarcobacter butzleri]